MATQNKRSPESALEEAQARLLEGALDEAEALVDGVLESASDAAAALHLAGLIAAQRGKLDRATELLHNALSYRSDDKAILRNLAALLLAQRDLRLARETLVAAEDAGAQVTELLEQLSGLETAAQEPARAELALGYDAHLRGDLVEALKHFRTGLAGGATDRRLHSAYLYSLLHDPEQNLETLRIEHELWTRTYCVEAASPRREFRNSVDPQRRLKVGYLCGEFRCAPLLAFLQPVLEAHDRNQVVVYGYNVGRELDACTGRFQAACDEWRDVAELPPSEVATCIRRDQIDVLLDAGGHLFSDTLMVYAHSPAPITVAYPHYPFSNHLPGLNYLLTDRYNSPPGSEREYAEALLRMPNSFVTYSPPTDASVLETPFLRNGFITFGAFQRPLKYNPIVWDAYAAILHGVPAARILIHFGVSELDDAESALRQRLVDQLGSRGIDRNRVLLRGVTDVQRHLQQVSDVDIALDTFPYNGQTTTCDALWMGVPVVTLRGETHFGRVGSALLACVGLTQLVASNPDEYVRLAVRLAADHTSLRLMRATLRGRMQSSSLGNPSKYTRELEQVYRCIWHDWCLKSA